MRLSLTHRLPAAVLSAALCLQGASAFDKPNGGASRPPSEPAPEQTPPAPAPSNGETAAIGDTPVATPVPSAPSVTEPASSASTGVDLIADKPEAGTDAKPVVAMMDEMVAAEPLNEKGTRCYSLIANLKTNTERIRADLMQGGKEITRLMTTSDNVSRNVTELSKLWPTNKKFLDVCSSAKRSSVILNDELSNVPRQWSHVRWSYENMLTDVRAVRLVARILADSEPKPVAVVGKDGKVTYVDAPTGPIDPKVARRNEAIRRTEDAKAHHDEFEKTKSDKDKEMPVDLRNVR